METTFINQNTKGTIVEEGLASLESTAEDMAVFMEDPDGTDELGSFYDYGLAFDYVAADDDGEKAFNAVQDGTSLEFDGYYRYQISWGGPSEEVRFYQDRTEYVYLDWFCGVGFDVSHTDWAEWLRDWFTDCEMIKF